jgi:NADPH:quinone reductase-like Zn-dependent oxidoreductase
MMKTVTIGAPWGVDGLSVTEREIPEPGPGEVLVRVRASSLNYHDLLVVRNTIPSADGRVPLSDGAGEVVAAGPGVTRFAIGDPVMSTFFPGWHDGPAAVEKKGRIPGTNTDGFASEYVVRSESSLTRQPAGYSMAEAATLPCAGLTAWSAVTACIPLHPGDWVLTLGTGAVSLFALQFAKASGARVIATSSSEEKLDTLSKLGADHVVNYRTEPSWGRAVREITGGRGVDLVVEVGGSGSLRQSIAASRTGGHIAMIGLLAGDDVGGAPMVDLVLNTITIHGVSVGSHAGQLSMVEAIEATGIRPVIDASFPLLSLADAFTYQESQQNVGKISILI